jgi:hypothetical protein
VLVFQGFFGIIKILHEKLSIFNHIIYAFVQTIKGGAFMKLCITAGNYHIFKLMIKNHKDSRIQLKNIHPLDFDLVFDVYTSLDQKTVISILSHELRYSPFMYLCPGFKVIPLKKRLPHGTKESTTPLNLSFN